MPTSVKFVFRYFPFLVIPPMIVFALLMAGCASTDETSSDQNSVTMQTQLTASTVSQAAPEKGASPSAINSIVVTKASVFITNVKLHSDKDDSVKDDHDGTIKTGPMVLVFDSSGVHSTLTTSIPADDYDHIKFEIHKPDSKNSDDAALLAQFSQFQNGDKPYTVVVEGYTTDLIGTQSRFTVRSSKNENISIHMKDKDDKEQVKVHFSGGGSSILLFLFDPTVLFKVGGILLDPNQAVIDDHLTALIKVQVK
jgi:hypothetical protein